MMTLIYLTRGSGSTDTRLHFVTGMDMHDLKSPRPNFYYTETTDLKSPRPNFYYTETTEAL